MKQYYIAVEVVATGPIADLAAAIQRAYDGGAAGDFKVLATHAPSYMVIFKRDAGDDGEYVSQRSASGTSIEHAAMQQLAAELEDGGVGPCAQSVVDVLRSGDAHCFDFGIGALEAMA
jgi:hypothetical protein